jgi:hypothetical protein
MVKLDLNQRQHKGNNMHFHDDPPPSKGWGLRGCLFQLVVMTLAIMLCLSGITVAVDASCHRDSTRWLVDYPDSEVVSHEYTFIRAWGIGETTRMLYSPHDPTTVRLWYNNHNTEIASQGHVRGGGQADMRWQIIENPDGDGTLIVLTTRCATQIFP